MNSANNSLFLGDLSKFCTEVELENLFSCCGQILDVKIKRNNNTGKTLSYGFVTFANEEIAANAMKMMDGTMFYGRKLRIRWAQYNARSQNPIHDSVINSVYVRFVTPKLDVFVTEEDLHNVFDKFGSVVDASIKESSIDKRTSRQSGYGFVHFSCDKAGVECAFQAVTALDNATINGVTYYVELSKNLLKQFNEMQQQGPMAGALHGPPDMGAPRSPMAGAGYAHNQHRGGGRPAGPQGDHFQNYPWAGGAHPSAYQQQQQAPHGYPAHPHHHHQQQQQQQQFGQFHYGGGAATPQSEQEYYEEGFGHANPLPVLPAQQGYSPKTTHHFPPARPPVVARSDPST